MVLRTVWIMPLLSFIFSIAAFVVSYGVAVLQGHVTAFWPYISDSGTMPPESCIFGQLLNLAALFHAITVYLRHRQIVEFYWHQLKLIGSWRTISVTLLWIGYLSAFGMSMVGNFQEMNVLYAHYAGAMMTFGCGLIYAWGQTIFSYRMTPKMSGWTVFLFRMVLTILSTLFFVTTLVFGMILGRQPADWKKNETALYHWTTDTPNYREHIIGTCSEWLLAICFLLYILSFAIELRNACCHAPKLCLKPLCYDPQKLAEAFQTGEGIDGIAKVHRCWKSDITRVLDKVRRQQSLSSSEAATSGSGSKEFESQETVQEPIVDTSSSSSSTHPSTWMPSKKVEFEPNSVTASGGSSVPLDEKLAKD